jgi:ATP-binding cassette subfamily B protein
MFRRYACVKQHDQTDCGAAVIATVARQFGLHAGVARVRELIGTDLAGTNLAGLAKGAEALGFDAKPAKGDWDALLQVPLPLIAHWVTEQGFGHFVVVHRIKRGKVLIADPGRGLVTVPRDEFARRWTGYCLLVTPKNLRPDLPSPSKAAFVGELVRPHRGILGSALFCALLFTVLGLGTSFFVQHLVDSILVHARARLLNLAAVGMLVLLAFRAVFSFVRGYFLVDIARKVDLTLIACYMRHILRLPMKFFETRRVGEILSRVNDAVKIRSAISSAVLTTVVDGTMVVAAAVTMVLMDARLALVCLAFAPLFVGTLLVLRRPIAKRQRAAMERAADAEARLVEDVTAVETIKAFGAEPARTQQVESRLVKLVQSMFTTDRLGLVLETITMVVGGAGTLAVLWYGGHRVIEGGVTIGTLMFFYTLAGYLFGPLERLAGVTLTVQDAAIALDRLWEVLCLDLEEKPKSLAARPAPIREALRFEAVRFAYGCRGEVLKGLDLDVPAGQVVAIVGESGCGKSTVCKLTSKFYEPTQGRILVDGTDLRDLPAAEWRRKIGYVAQDPHIFNGTIADNIRFGKPDASLEDVVRAARVAGLDGFIDTLPERYGTLIGERGVNMSGGQRQRLAIARAILCEPELFILDEATSHLDTQTERAIQRTLKEALAGRTAIIVAHRLSTIRHADLIYVLRDGVVSEWGTHDELLEMDGEYAALWRAQTEGEERPEPIVLLGEPDATRFFRRNGSTRSRSLTAGGNGVSHAYHTA